MHTFSAWIYINAEYFGLQVYILKIYSSYTYLHSTWMLHWLVTTMALCPSMYSNCGTAWDEGRELLTVIKLEIMSGIKMHNGTVWNVPIKEEQHTKSISVKSCGFSKNRYIIAVLLLLKQSFIFLTWISLKWRYIIEYCYCSKESTYQKPQMEANAVILLLAILDKSINYRLLFYTITIGSKTLYQFTR